MYGTKESLLCNHRNINVNFAYSVWWNLLLIAIGSYCIAVGTKSLAVPHQFIPGGIFGLATLSYYCGVPLSPGWLYTLLNVPLFLFAWFKVSKRFFWYSVFAVMVTTIFYEVSNVKILLENQLYASVASGVVTGFGAGVVLRSLGSNGGLDVVAVFLFQRFNIGIGKVYLLFNTILYSFSLYHTSLDLIVASLIMVFVTSVVLEQTFSLLSPRKVVFIISNMSEEISQEILDTMHQSATFLKGFGAFSKKDKNVLMTVVNNVQLKRLEEITFKHDASALFIVENTFSVIGSSFSRRKLY